MPPVTTAPVTGVDRYIVLRSHSADGVCRFVKAWPFDHPPAVGDHVSVPVFGWDAPCRVSVQRLWWEPSAAPVGGVLWVELFDQPNLTRLPTAGELESFYLSKGWVRDDDR